MKNIGIITYHRATNYGAVLQAYSLVNRIKADFPEHNVEIIDYSTANRSKSHTKEILRALVRSGIKSGIDIYKKNRVFDTFSNRLPLSSKKIVSDDISQVMKYINDRYDIVISGSDAVFNWGKMPFPTVFLLGEQIDCKKMSYAASAHRLFYRDLSSDKIDYCRKAFTSYTYLGIRDAETEAFVHYCNPNIELQHTCDPTMFIDIKKIKNECKQFKLEKAFGIVNDKPLIVVMSPDKAIGQAIMERFSQDYNIVTLFVHNAAIPHHCSVLTPFDWANVFGFAKITVTEYFHATIFSLLNGTPSVSIDKLGYKSGYEGKIHDLLITRLDLPEFYLNTDDLADGDMTRVVKTMEKVMGGGYSERISRSIAKEGQSYNNFRDSLKKIIDAD